MPRTRRRKPLGVYRAVFADNLEAHLKAAYPAKPGERIDRPALFVRDHPGFAKSTINRWLNAETGANLDETEAVANALNTTPYEMLTPAARTTATLPPLSRKPQQQQHEDDLV